MSTENDQTDDNRTTDVHGLAAMTLVEAILLTLQSKGILRSDEVDEIFEVAIAAHRNRHEEHSKTTNASAARILDRLRVEGNSVRIDR